MNEQQTASETQRFNCDCHEGRDGCMDFCLVHLAAPETAAERDALRTQNAALLEAYIDRARRVHYMTFPGSGAHEGHWPKCQRKRCAEDRALIATQEAQR